MVGKEELSRFRKDIKDLAQMAITGPPAPQTPLAVADRVARMRATIADSERLEVLTDRIDLALAGG